MGHGHADLAGSGGPSPQDLHQRRPGGHAEDQPHGKKRELGGGHAAGIASVVVSSSDGTMTGA
jgi:hypothetical protein